MIYQHLDSRQVLQKYIVYPIVNVPAGAADSEGILSQKDLLLTHGKPEWVALLTEREATSLSPKMVPAKIPAIGYQQI